MFGKDEAPETRLRRKFWSALDDSPFIMLGLKGVEDDRTRPMTAQVDVPKDGDKEDGGQIYFFGTSTCAVIGRVRSSSTPFRPSMMNGLSSSALQNFLRNLVSGVSSLPNIAWAPWG